MSRLIKDIVLYMLSAFITFYSRGFTFKGKRVTKTFVFISSELSVNEVRQAQRPQEERNVIAVQGAET